MSNTILSLPDLELKEPAKIISPPQRLIYSLSPLSVSYNNYGGALTLAAKELKIPLSLILAVFMVEAGGQAFDPDSHLVIIRCETRAPLTEFVRFKDKSGEFRNRFGSGQGAEWEALSSWLTLEDKRPYDYTSYGLPQIMGFNHKYCGYKNAKAMLVDFQKSPDNQIMAFARFIKNYPNNLLKHLKNKNWPGFASIYNGPGQVEFYAKKLDKAFIEAERFLDNA